MKPTLLEYMPDEILLNICQYLSQYDIVVAFFGLNKRLNCTISQFLQSLTIANDNFLNFYGNRKLLFIIGPYLDSLTIKNTNLSSSEINLASNIHELTLIHAQLDQLPVIFCLN